MIEEFLLKTPMEMTNAVVAKLKTASTVTKGSLPEYTAPTRLSPTVLIDNKVSNMDQGLVKALLQTLLSIYSAYYLQAITLSTSINNIQVLRLLDKFSTDRDVLLATDERLEKGFSFEDLDNTLELPDYTLEAKDDSSKFDKNFVRILDNSNLAVGKVLDVKITDGGNEVSIPVTITLKPKTINSSDVINISASDSIDKTIKGRYHQWRSGEIRFIKDYLLNLDILEADLKGKLSDSSGALMSIRSKRTKGILSTLITGKASPNSVSTMVIIAKSTAKELELVLKGKLKSHRVRSEFFKSNVLMMLVVVDTVMERFTIYQRGIKDYGEYTLDDIKNNDRNTSGVDIEAVMKAYSLGNAATL